MQKKHLYHFKKRTVSLMLAMLMILSTVLTGCGTAGVTASALEDDHSHEHVAAEAVSDETVSLRETFSDRLDSSLAKQAAAIGDEYWENDVPADEDAVFYEYAENEQVSDVPNYDTGSSVALDSVDATTVEKDFDENGLRETAFNIQVMYTTVDDDFDPSTITDMWNYNYESFIANYDIVQPLYEVKGMDDVYAIFLNFSELNGINGKIVAADFSRGTELNPILMNDEVVMDEEAGILYVPKAWCFAGDGTETGLDLKAQVMVAVDSDNAENTDEYGNLLVKLSVEEEGADKAGSILHDGTYSMKAYEFGIIPLFEPGTVGELTTDDIDVYINGSTQPLTEESLSYNPESGNLTVKEMAVALAQVKVVFKQKSLAQAVSGLFSVGNAKAASNLTNQEYVDGMVPLSYVETDENGNEVKDEDGKPAGLRHELNPNIDLNTIGVGDVLAYATVGKVDTNKTVADRLRAQGSNEFVYTSKQTQENTTLRNLMYWYFVGNKNPDLSKAPSFVLKGATQWGFVMELPFASPEKGDHQMPVVIKSNSGKSAVGSAVYFGSQNDWKWCDVAGKGKVDENGMMSGYTMEYSVYGQCAHTSNSTYLGNTATGETSKVAICTGCECSECKAHQLETGLNYCDATCTHCAYGLCEHCKDNMFICGSILTNDVSGEYYEVCNCPECMTHRAMTGLPFCDITCEHCRSGQCSFCSTEWVQETSKFKVGGTCRILTMGDGYMVLGLANVANGSTQRGTTVIKVRTSVKIMVKKNSSSTLNDGTVGNSCYAPLDTARYTVYEDEACTKEIGTIAGDGEDFVLVPIGHTYYIKETTAPVGYWIDPKVYPVEPTENTVYDMTNDPMDDPLLIAIQKNVENRDTAGVTAGDVGDLKGLQFDVDYYKGVYSSLEDLPAESDEHAVFETDENGFLLLDDDHLVAGETWKYRTEETGELSYPLGTIRVKEKFSIPGLLIISDSGMLFTVTDESDKSDDTIKRGDPDVPRHTTYAGSSNKETTGDRVAGSYENSIVKGGVTVVKSDYDWDKSDFQGDATLAGAEYTIYNRSESPVYYKGNLYEAGAAVDVITTQWDDTANVYVASTGGKVLEYGTYEIVETKAPTGYNLPEYKPGEKWSRTFTIREDGQMHYFNQKNPADSVDGLNWLHRWNVDTVMRGGVVIGKVDRETKQYITSGGASLTGAKFEIINRSEHPVYVDGTTYAPGEVVMTLTAGEMDITGADGSTKHIVGNTTGNYVLPYGTYDIREVATGIGYLFDTDSQNQLKTFSIRDEGEMHYFTDEDDAFHNQVQREDWYFQKKADDSGERMDNVAWTVTSVTTGEVHVIVTDENGKYQSDQVPHTQRTNANDPDSPISNGAIQIDEDGDYYVADPTLLDYDAGTWFTGMPNEMVQWAEDGNSYTVVGGTDHVTAVDDWFRAYPYDTYVVQELASDANEGYNLVSFTVTLKRYNDDPDSNGIILDYGTVDDQHVDIYTVLGYKADGFKADAKSVPSATDTTLTDTITYAGLTAGGEYTVKGELHLIDAEGNDEGVVATNDTTFTAKASGQLKTDFTLDTSAYAGKKLVAVEEIWQSKTLLTREDDLTNEDQTVWVAGITATKAERVEGNPDIITIKDHVDYANLAIGGVYNMNLSLMDKATGEALLDKNGNAVTAELQFVPGSISGMQDITVTFTPAVDLNTDVVVFEEITHGQVYGEHKDLDDADQTISFRDMIDTYAVSGSNYSKELSADKDQSIYDCIKLNGLADGTTYRLVGGVYYINDDGEAVAISDADGNAITNTIDNPDADTVMMFKGIDATKLGGKDVVVFQSLYVLDESTGEYKLVFEHADAEDEDQIVHVPSIDTELVSTEKIHNAQTGTATVLTDRVDYKNLTPGQTYTATGTLHYREDTEVENGHEAVDMGEVESVVGKAEFTPDAKDGSVEVTFTYDSTNMDGKVVVAFEELYTAAGYQIPEAWASFFGTQAVALADEAEDADNTDTADTADTGAEAAQTRLVAVHKDIADTAQSVGFAKIKATTLTAGEGLKGIAAGGEITLTDAVEYEGLVPGMTYVVNGTLNDKDSKEVVATAEMKFVPESINGIVNVPFTFDSTGFSGKTVVAFETITNAVDEGDGVKLASHEDINDAAQSVTFTELDTVLTARDAKGKYVKAIEFGYYKGKAKELKDGGSPYEIDVIELKDTVKYEGLTPGSEYLLKGEIHMKDADGNDAGFVKGSETKFTPAEVNGEVEMIFRFAPVGIENDIIYVAYEYLYSGGEAVKENLISSHADIADADQTITAKPVDKTPDDKKDPDKNPCGCTDPNCKHKNEKNHCKNNPGCCDDSDCCKDCKTCKHKNPCGCEDPNCKHKNEKDHCKNNPGCCDGDDCCKNCKTCKSKNLCGCDDPNCKHKNEKNHCKNNPGCCDDSDCCKDCKTCKSKIPVKTETNKCGCTDPNCKHKNEKDHCKNNPGCCDDSDCCKDCKTCKSKTPAKTEATTKPSKNPVANVIEAVKTGEHTFLLVAMIGLMLMSGGGYVFFSKTSKGRDVFRKIRRKFGKK